MEGIWKIHIKVELFGPPGLLVSVRPSVQMGSRTSFESKLQESVAIDISQKSLASIFETFDKFWKNTKNTFSKFRFGRLRVRENALYIAFGARFGQFWSILGRKSAIYTTFWALFCSQRTQFGVKKIFRLRRARGGDTNESRRFVVPIRYSPQGGCMV